MGLRSVRPVQKPLTQVWRKAPKPQQMGLLIQWWGLSVLSSPSVCDAWSLPLPCVTIPSGRHP